MNIIEAIQQLSLDLRTWVSNNLLTKVDKETGKGLSTNDYTDDEKESLSNLISQYSTGAYFDSDEFTDKISSIISTTDGSAKIACISYVGTGLNGISNKNTLSFNFNPKFIMILPTTMEDGSYTYVGFFVKDAMIFFNGGGFGYISSTRTNSDGLYTLTWYVSGTASRNLYSGRQLNLSGVTYNCVALG